MNSLKGIRFRGEFRDYQRRVLEGAPRFLNDGKINIVAPPGSGKTVLGLELICRLGGPCLILSPTTTIRDQWGERFESGFLPEGSALSEWFSDDLTTPRPQKTANIWHLVTVEPARVVKKGTEKLSALLSGEDGSALAVECDEQGVAAEFSLKNASVHEQNLFAQAAAELFSPIRNPRFLLIGRGLPGFRYACSLACPSAIGEDKKLAGILAARLKKNMGRMEVVYTRTEKGRALILKCRNRSLVTLNRRFLDPKQKVSRWE